MTPWSTLFSVVHMVPLDSWFVGDWSRISVQAVMLPNTEAIASKLNIFFILSESV